MLQMVRYFTPAKRLDVSWCSDSFRKAQQDGRGMRYESQATGKGSSLGLQPFQVTSFLMKWWDYPPNLLAGYKVLLNPCSTWNMAWCWHSWLPVFKHSPGSYIIRSQPPVILQPSGFKHRIEPFPYSAKPLRFKSFQSPFHHGSGHGVPEDEEVSNGT